MASPAVFCLLFPRFQTFMLPDHYSSISTECPLASYVSHQTIKPSLKLNWLPLCVADDCSGYLWWMTWEEEGLLQLMASGCPHQLLHCFWSCDEQKDVMVGHVKQSRLLTSWWLGTNDGQRIGVSNPLRACSKSLNFLLLGSHFLLILPPFNISSGCGSSLWHMCFSGTFKIQAVTHSSFSLTSLSVLEL